jgi:hypothetical protein
MNPLDALKEIASSCDGKIETVGLLPDGSGFATMSMPLPKTHWIYNQDDSIGSGPPPMPFRMGAEDQASLLLQRAGSSRPFACDPPVRMTKELFAAKIREATRYAIRSATMCGKDMDFDPDALVQNMQVGMLGYWTEDGLSSDDWANPPDQQRRG